MKALSDSDRDAMAQISRRAVIRHAFSDRSDGVSLSGAMGPAAAPRAEIAIRQSSSG